MDKRIILLIFLVIVGLFLSANLILSVDKTSEIRNQLKVANQLLLTTQELQIQYNVAHAAITAFMFLGSNETWNIAAEQTQRLSIKAIKLIELNNTQATSQQKLVRRIEKYVSMYISALPALRGIRQNHLGIIEGVVISNLTQSTQYYRFTSSLSNAIEMLVQEENDNELLIIQLQSVQNRWLRVITEFRALLLLRSDQAKQATLINVEQFEKEWNKVIKDIDNFDIEIKPLLEFAHENQRQWLESLPQVINVHLGKQWRRDLRYMEEKLNPISDGILLSLNDYNFGLVEYIAITANKIASLEKRNIIWVFIIMGLIVVFSLSLLFIYKRLLVAQQRKRLDAEHVNQLKTEFLSTISHELRTPLNAILGFAQLLEMNIDSSLSKQQKENINEINVAGNHLLHLVNEILDLSAIESGNININMEKVDLIKVLNESIALSKTMAEKYSVSVNIQTTTGVAFYVNADPVRLRQIFINLISNAIKYNKQEGKTRISIEHKATMTRINIKDTGYGISKQDIGKLFQPFERLGNTNNIEGAGIGLMVTKGLVESMNGTIGVNSKQGKGSTFWVELLSAS